MLVYLCAFLIGVVTGLRSLTAPAAMSWAARLGWLPLAGTPLAFLGSPTMPWVFTGLALVELVWDKLPKAPSRKEPMGFGARILGGALTGGAIGAARGMLVPALVAGVLGGVAGTLGGAKGRATLARLFGKDLPAALLEDVIAVSAAFGIAIASAV